MARPSWTEVSSGPGVFGVRTIVSFAMPVALGLGLPFVPARRASAVPAFAEQTGLSCQACHVGGFGPQLTPFGREFKLNGYTMRAKAFNVPLSAMAVASVTHTRKDQVPAPDGLDRNDNLAFDQGSLFVAGGIGNHLGGFAQITYDGVAKAWAWDNLDVRAVTRGNLFGTDAVFGLTLNNSPTVQDAWNTTPAWGFPYTDTAVSGTPDAAPLIDDALAQNTLGLSAYAWVGQKIYAEAGAYTSPSAGTLDWLGADPADPGDIHGLAPYGRLAWQGQVGGGTLEAGAFALKAAINPGRDRSTGLYDRYTDLGLDASWQKVLSSGDTISTQLRYVHESSNLRASCALALVGDGTTPDCAHGHLAEWRGDVGYTWHNRIGATLGAFAVTGSRNGDLYGGNGKPDSNGVMAQVDYTPWGGDNSPLGPRVNLRVGLQYTAYGKFNGARHNYDGAGADAADNNALRLYTWLAF
ncbi:MAG: hypothetical protein PHE36_14880 [Novosphingobium sp.]|nr:hypothetical protein [Novosphingobium sp.]